MIASPTYVGRLAFSPTGLLHIGHAATFLIAHHRARAAQGRLFLRIDDLDTQRSRERFIEDAREDLHWLGITWDEEVRETTQLPHYSAAIHQLIAGGLAYPCTCSRKDLQESLSAPHEDTDDEPVYNGRCRPLLESQPQKLQPAMNYRFRVPDGEMIRFHDEACGPQQFFAGREAGTDLGDFLVWRKDGLPSYQLACAVDDRRMGITEVVRGRDLLKSTARQILLQRALGYPTPAYLHTVLLRDSNGVRLAKRHDALSVRSIREAGTSAATLRAQLLANDPSRA